MKPIKLKSRILVLIALAFTVNASAQILRATLSHYSTDNGLASNTISHILQDDYGYIWISTWNGLSRFDGYNFFNYTTGAASHIPNLHNRIRHIALDSHQNVWMLMYDGRVFVVKRSIDRIINPFEDIPSMNDYRFEYPLTVTSSGDVILNADKVGLYKVRFEGDEVSAQLITTSGLQVTSLAEGYQNDIWLGTNEGVHRLDMSNLTVERKGYFLDEEITNLYSNGYNIFVGTQTGRILSFSYGQKPETIRFGGNTVTSLFVDSYGVVWFTDTEPGALRIKSDAKDEKRFTQRIIMPDYDGWGGEFGESNGYVWMRMNKGGYGYYNRDNDEVEYFHNDPSNPWNLSNTVNARLELNEGVVWESTNRLGLDKLEILRHTIERVSFKPEEGPSPSNEIRALLYDGLRHDLLIGNKAGTLYVIEHDGERSTVKSGNTPFAFGRIYGLSQDRRNNYWVSCKGTGLYLVKPIADGQYSITNYRNNPTNEWSLNDDRCYQAVEDKNGNLWVATYGGGVNIMTRDKNGIPIFLHNKNVMRNYPETGYQKVRTLALDGEGNVWAGTTDGILIMSYKDKKISIQKLESSKEYPDKILMSTDVVCMARDRQGDMWIGTSGGGLSHSIGKDSQGHLLFENFGVDDGLPSEEVRGITFDELGNIWFSTDHVLYSFNADKRVFTTFSTLDGVDDTTCSEGAAISLPNGNVLFGTLNGYYVVDRTKLVNSTGSILKLRITDFWINDELQTPRHSGKYDYYVPDSKSVKLSNHSDVFSFRFASLNYHLQHRVHYQYMLEGYDEDWQNADRSRIATYNNLPTGNYRFKVKAFLLESPERYDLKQIEVIVPPYFLLSSNAIWLYMALSIAFGISLMFRRQKHLAKAEKVRLLREGPRRVKAQIVNNDFMIFLNEYLNLHYSDPMLSVDEIVAASAQPETEFTATLHKLTGQTPKEFILDYRIRKAVDMIEKTDETIAGVSYKCGFIDASVFNRLFRSKTGFSPSRYRDLHKKINADIAESDLT